MNHRAPRRRRRADLPPGGPLRLLLGLPARLGIRRPFILIATAAAMGLYAHVLLAAPPMPPSRVPVPAATPR
ncbi:hypothetical protein [Kitasatospora cathayae]|uniref:Uncharacterized protein n=1 Tax=Kitasatospora cathayae TaxID=3004092 RepID=A0ABY7Q0T4_9ACTN|nr:hypothetical protein [Kitasatospora sp. HUAS 3-15]WBP86328.1 hypothetical protein O1G21_11065 [Kitasatospora sp. HUAS 3-15]